MSNFLPSSSSPFTPEIAGTLAAVSYLDPSDAPATQLADMSTALSNSALPTGGQWEIAWGPADLGGNLMYIAQLQGTSSGSTVAVVIRGTIFDFPSDLLDDTEVATQVALPFPPPSGFSENAKISFGAGQAWMNLASMIPSVGDSSVDAFQFLKGLTGPVSVLVTGHSLGGQLATVAAVWIAGFLSSADVQVITFAAPTAGNPDFQGSFDSLFQGKAVRYFTNLDIVPRLWVPTGDFDLDSIEQLFPGGPQCDAGCHTAVSTAKHIVRNVTYAQPTVATMLTSAVYSEGPIGAFEQEGSQQHRMLLYLYRLGVSASVIQSTFDSSWMPPPNV
jgi:hypothetical protein